MPGGNGGTLLCCCGGLGAGAPAVDGAYAISPSSPSSSSIFTNYSRAKKTNDPDGTIWLI